MMVTTNKISNQQFLHRWMQAFLPLLAMTVFFAGMLTSPAALAQSGKFSYVVGTVYVETNGMRVNATRGMNVNAGDLVVTLADGMAQLSMIDEAKISLRSGSRLRIERYAIKKEGGEGAILSLLSGTLRTFTGLLTSANREKYQMKTRVATVGIRGSGNILQHTDEGIPTTLNYTIEGSHVVATIGLDGPGLITRPDQTVRVEAGKLPELVSTPASILSASAKMIGELDPEASQRNFVFNKIELRPPVSVGTNGAEQGLTGRVFPPFVLNEARIAPNEPTGLREISVAVAGGTYSSQALPADTRLEDASLRGLQSYPGLQTTQTFGIQGGTAVEVQTVDVGNSTQITVGRWAGASSFSFTGSSFQPAGSVHFAYGGAGYPSYLSDVLTGTVSYTRVAATSPTNQLAALGTLTNSILDVNFTQRTLNTTLGISMPSATPGATADTWTLQASNLPFTANRFFAATGLGLTITNRAGLNSNTNDNLFGSLEGSFVGAGLNGAIIGYGFLDSTNQANISTISGVVAFRGPVQNIAEAYRTGLVSDPSQALLPALFARSFVTTIRPAELAIDPPTQAQSQARVTAFAAPYVVNNSTISHQRYQIGTAQVADAGFDAATGLVWGRWSGGSATIAGQNVALANRSLHYIFSGTQSGPVALPLTGTASYDVVGSTNPTDLSGNIGRLNSASLNANFSARTVDTSLNLTIAGQTWNASTIGAPINRDQYFSAFSGGPNLPGLPRPAQLLLSCTPSCTPMNPTGSLDGFFTGRTGDGAAVMYNLNNTISGAIAFRRRAR